MNSITRYKLGKAIADKILSTGINPWVVIIILLVLWLGITCRHEIVDFFKKRVGK